MVNRYGNEPEARGGGSIRFQKVGKNVVTLHYCFWSLCTICCIPFLRYVVKQHCSNICLTMMDTKIIITTEILVTVMWDARARMVGGSYT